MYKRQNGECLGEKEIDLSCSWEDSTIEVKSVEGIHALYFLLYTESCVEFMEFSF